MFDNLSDRLSSVFDKLTGRGALSEKDVKEAMREVRRALLEADVALEVVKDFIEKVTVKAVGQDVIKSVTPGQMVIKIVHDEMIEMLGSDAAPISLNATAPVPIMLVGLQGSGKTTSCAKIALRLKKHHKSKVLMASLDTYRPAAQEQLKVLGKQCDIATLPIVKGQNPVQIASRAMQFAKLSGFDVVMLDTAGRLHIDEELMKETEQIREIANPHETLLVADSLTGQDAVNLAREFNSRIGVSGIVLTRIDGDGRGGAALSMRAVTGKPIKLLGTGEQIDALEDFHPERIAGRILGKGDIVSLVEKASETLDAEKSQRMAEKMRKGKFDLEDLAEQIKQMQKMGGMGSIMGMLPGMGKIKKQLDKSDMDDKVFLHQLAIISSMTKKERRRPKLLNASRKKRIAKGCGRPVQEINKLLKMHRQMADMMKKMGKKGGLAGMFGGMGGMMGGGGMPPGGMDPAALDPGKLPPDFKLPSGLGVPTKKGGLPGLGGGGLPGLPGGGKKKK